MHPTLIGALLLTAVALTTGGALTQAAASSAAPAPQAVAPAPQAVAPADAPQLQYQLPVDGVVLRLFDAPAQPWSSGHRGVDLQAAPGGPVLAPAPGVVSFSGSVAGRGVLTVDHPDGLRSSFEPVSGSVEVGTDVAAGQVIGSVTAELAHCGTQRCLHWGVRRGDAYLNPLRLLPGSGPVVLLQVQPRSHS